MYLEWNYESEENMTVLQFLRTVKLPRRYITRLKYQGGDIRVNHQTVTVRHQLKAGDHVSVYSPDELGHETVPPSDREIEVVYEDRDLLVINKPVQVVSIPSRKHPDSSVANQVKGYYMRQGYKDQVIHIVTRLDRDTSGLMLIAKHRLAHAWMDQQIQEGLLEKYYIAISHKQDWLDHGMIDAPIARTEESIITRQVADSGQAARTEYWLQQRLDNSAVLRLQLHTGRTHQIRVHTAYMGGPLVGDDLYGGDLIPPLTRQALHCAELHFYHPFTNEVIHLKQELPEDMKMWIDKHQINR